MLSRSLVAVGLIGLCLAALWGVLAQGRQISELRAQQKRLEPANHESIAPAAETVTPTPEVPRELLQLRAEVARLSQQQRELAGAWKENEKLRLQLENRTTNNASGKAAGASYIKMSQVKWLGCNTPEDTLQSAFWAMQNHDVPRYLETIRPDVAKEIAENESRSAEEFFKGNHLPPIFKIAGRRQKTDPNDDEFIDLEVEIAPDIPPEPIFFRRVAGQWKLDSRL